MEKKFYQSIVDSLPPDYIFIGSEKLPESELLFLLRKYCTPEALLFSGKRDGEVFQYYKKTMSILDEELRHKTISVDMVYTIMSNLMLVATNQYYVDGKRKIAASGDFVTTDQESKYLMSLIKRHWKIEEHTRIDWDDKKQSYRRKALKQRMMMTFSALLFGLGSVFSAIYSSQRSSLAKSQSLQKKSLFHRIGDWWKYDLWHMTIPVNHETAQAIEYKNIALILAGISGLVLVAVFFQWVHSKRVQHRDSVAEKRCIEYQFICNVGKAVDESLKEDYCGWN